MFISDDLVYIHIPKTGGTFVEVALRRLYDSTGQAYVDSATREGQRILRTKTQHETVRGIPAPHREKPIVFTVRNPFDYYVSLYEFGWWKRHPEAEFDEERVARRFKSYPNLRFSEFVAASNDWSLWPESDRSIGKEMTNHRVGLLTWKLITMLSLAPRKVFRHFDDQHSCLFESHWFPRLHALRMEHLAHDLIDFLRSRGIPDLQTAFVNELGRIFPAEGGRDRASDWRTYYDPSSESFVRSAERAVFACWPEYDE